MDGADDTRALGGAEMMSENVRLTDEQLNRLAELEEHNRWTIKMTWMAQRDMAHELIAARARIAELEAENARLRGDNMGDDIARADRFSKWKKQVANGARVCVRCGGANLALNIDGGASHDWFCNDCLEYGNWEDND